ncbi:MAG TPA: hypothetical protein VGS08_00420 [Candidatus Saccharimonadales bacterium]|nr:hypothetical protein [Candidatus Saccharimonadales bacterium]
MKNYKSIQVRVRESTHHHIMVTAYSNGMTGAEFILHALTKHDDEKLAKLIEIELKKRPKPGMPQTRRTYLKLLLKHLPPRLKGRSAR